MLYQQWQPCMALMSREHVGILRTQESGHALHEALQDPGAPGGCKSQLSDKCINAATDSGPEFQKFF